LTAVVSGGERLYAALVALRRRVAPRGTRRDAAARAIISATATVVERMASTSGANASTDGSSLVPVSPTPLEVRARVGREWLVGEGLEIGALHLPMPLPDGASVRYVDRMGVPDLRVEYPELGSTTLVVPDIIDDGESLGTLGDATVDFVVANHFIEHCQDPIGALETMLRVVRPGGLIFMAVPDKRRTFDVARPVTTLEHVIRDHEEGPERSYRAHVEEWVALVDHGPDASIDVDDLVRRNASIHFHVWHPPAFLDLVRHCQRTVGVAFDLALFQQNGPEFLVILARLAEEDEGEVSAPKGVCQCASAERGDPQGIAASGYGSADEHQ
jgi:SAM-dependent methyltransferase